MDKFNDNKAGMTGLDKEKIQMIIDKNTGMNFNSHSQKQRQRIEERIIRNKDLLERLTKEQLVVAEQEMDALALSIEAKRDLSRNLVHFDMDMFFAAVEMRDNPVLRTVPMAVGGESMLSTSNYIARKFGVRSAMPGFIARKLCPDLVIVSGHFDKYRRESTVIRKIFQEYDEGIRMGSLDEASLDLTKFIIKRRSISSASKQRRVRYDGKKGCICRLPLIKEGEEISENAAREVSRCERCGKEKIAIIDFLEFGNDIDSLVLEIRFLVEQATGLTCSAGIAANWMLSKICSDIKKPNGQFRLNNNKDEIVEFMRSLPIRKVSGIGKVTEALLSGLGITVCGDLFTNRAVLKLLFSEISSHWFLHVALGSSGSGWSDFEEDSHRKSISVERTFAPQRDIKTMLNTVRELCHILIDSISESSIEGGKSATLKIKFASFDVITRCHSTDFLITSANVLFPIVESLLKKEVKCKGDVRLLGVRLSRLKFINSEGHFGHEESSRKDKMLQKSLMDFICKDKTSLKTTVKRFKSNNTIEVPVLVELSSDEEDSQISQAGALGSHIDQSVKDIQASSELDEAGPSKICSEQSLVNNSSKCYKRKKRNTTHAKSNKMGYLTRYFPVDLT